MFIGVAEFGLSGHLGFDALLQIDPFHFDADISGSVALTAGGDDLMSVGLDATFPGPAPWNIAGNFKVHIIFFDVHKSFSHTWGDDAPAQQIAAVDVLALLAAAFADPRSWGAQLPEADAARWCRAGDSDAATVVAHPWRDWKCTKARSRWDCRSRASERRALAGAGHFHITDFRLNGTSGCPRNPCRTILRPRNSSI